MTPAARIQATIELLNELFTSWQEAKRFPADKLLDRFFKQRRYIGSKDRAAIGELFYWVLRHQAALQWRLYGSLTDTYNGRLLACAALLAREEAGVKDLESLCNGEKYAPAALTEEERARLLKPHGNAPLPARLNYPQWLEPELRASIAPQEYEQALAALCSQASTDLRCNLLKTTREALVAALQQEEIACSPAPLAPTAIRLAKRVPIFTSPLFKAGHFEVQDEGSQMVATLTDAKPGMKVIDFCAGAGGKTLAIAAQMKNKGRILAWDTSEKRLLQIRERLRRAGVDNVQIHTLASEHDPFIKRHKQSADRVLVDAPCSGSGTWRRNPDLKWRFTQQDLSEVIALQTSILQSASRLVRPGGRLIYATCSLLHSENERQVEKFLENNCNFRVVCAKKIWNNILTERQETGTTSEPVSYLAVSPHQDGVDGFFAAVLERIGTDQQKEEPCNEHVTSNRE